MMWKFTVKRWSESSCQKQSEDYLHARICPMTIRAFLSFLRWSWSFFQIFFHLYRKTWVKSFFWNKQNSQYINAVEETVSEWRTVGKNHKKCDITFEDASSPWRIRFVSHPLQRIYSLDPIRPGHCEVLSNLRTRDVISDQCSLLISVLTLLIHGPVPLSKSQKPFFKIFRLPFRSALINFPFWLLYNSLCIRFPLLFCCFLHSSSSRKLHLLV